MVILFAGIFSVMTRLWSYWRLTILIICSDSTTVPPQQWDSCVDKNTFISGFWAQWWFLREFLLDSCCPWSWKTDSQFERLQRKKINNNSSHSYTCIVKLWHTYTQLEGRHLQKIFTYTSLVSSVSFDRVCGLLPPSCFESSSERWLLKRNHITSVKLEDFEDICP